MLRQREEKPRHGYEIIKELEDRFGGAYSPSPGTVYPTLTMLEDLGYAKAAQDEGGRKVYEITLEGSAYLKEHSTTVDSIFDRIARFMEGFLDAPMMEVNGAFRRVARSAYGQASKHVNDGAKLQRIREILDRATAELEQLEQSGGSTASCTAIDSRVGSRQTAATRFFGLRGRLADQEIPPSPSPSPPPRQPRPSMVMPQLPPQREHVEERPTGRRLAILSLTALGIVYGDIGTSPLYAFREGFTGHHAYAATQENVYGLLSLITWALILVVSIKYLVLVVRADNRGEGGILALLALVLQQERRSEDHNKRAILVLLGLFGTALLLGDGMITPAISVLSAIEGLKVATPAFEPYVIVITLGILIGLFAVQQYGTARVGSSFGPITLLWFLTIAVLGVRESAREPNILAALSPHHAVAFFVNNGPAGFFVLGAVVL